MGYSRELFSVLHHGLRFLGGPFHRPLQSSVMPLHLLGHDEVCNPRLELGVGDQHVLSEMRSIEGVALKKKKLPNIENRNIKKKGPGK